MATTLQQWLDQTLAVIVLYKTPLQEAVAFRSLLTSLKKSRVSIDWLVYDNSPDDKDLHLPEDIRIFYRPDPSNSGVSQAYNEGYAKARTLGKKWLMLLDQDTEFSADAIEKYYQGLRDFPGEACFAPRLIDGKGIISPFRFRMGNGMRVKSVPEGVKSLNQLQFVNSGLMISVDAFGRTSGYDEGFPLDYSDYAFVERLKKVHSTFTVLPLICRHNFSASSGASFREAVDRFSPYLQAAKNFKKKYQRHNHWIILRTWLRCLKLSLKFRTLAFMVSLLKFHA
jgi:rhamnosyltransferase